MKGYIEKFYNVEDSFLERLISIIFLALLILFIVGIVSAISNMYDRFLKYLSLLIFIILANLTIVIFVNYENIKADIQKNRFTYIVIAALLLFSIFNSNFFSEIKIEGGHDQGVYLENAISIVKNMNLSLDNIITISYPGFWIFEDNKILSQFLPGYPIFLSMFYYLFGFKGFAIANAVLLFFGASFLFFLGKNIRDIKTGIFVLSFFILNYYTIYFSRATYIENLQFALIWSSVYMFMIGYNKRKLNWIVYGSIPISLLLLVRIEAFLYIIVYMILIYYFKYIRKWCTNDDRHYTNILLVLNLLIFSSYILYVYLFNPSIISSFIYDYIRMVISNPTNTLTKTSLPYSEQFFIWLYMFYVFLPIGVVLMTILGIINALCDAKIRDKLILVTILILPQFVFLIKPGIAFYLPWFMRRFWPVLLPYIFLIFALFLTNKNNFPRRLKLIVAIVLLLITLTQSSNIITFSNGKGIIDFTKTVSSNFDSNDLVIFWDKYQYENFGPPLYFMYGTNVVFDRGPAFDPQLYATFMNGYKNIYIVTSRGPNKSISHPYLQTGSVQFIKTLRSENIKMISENSCNVRELIVYPERFRTYYQIQDMCIANNPPTEKTNYTITLNIYKIKNPREFYLLYYNHSYPTTLYNLKNNYSGKLAMNMN